MADPTQFLSNPIVALSLRAVLGGYVIFMARRFYADPTGYFREITARGGGSIMAGSAHSGTGLVLPVGRMLHCGHGGSGADSWPAWRSVGRGADESVSGCHLAAVAQAGERGRGGQPGDLKTAKLQVAPREPRRFCPWKIGCGHWRGTNRQREVEAGTCTLKTGVC